MRQYQKDESQINKNLALLKKAFPPDRLSTIEDYVDLFLRYRGVKYRDYFLEFGLLLMERGYNYTSCQINELITDRLLNDNYKSFKLKKRHEIDKMTGREFEDFLARFFKKCGCQVKMTPRSHDKGSDLIVQLNGISTVVQAKRRKENIGIKAVQEAYTAMGYYRTDKAMVIIASKFSKHAKEMAEKLNVELSNTFFFIIKYKVFY
jgi:hypothetical protein